MPTAATPLKIWDLPTRLFHWTLAVAVIALIVTAQLGGNWMVWHLRLGYLVLGLLLFRLMWGVLGGHWSRFATFTYGPAALRNHLRGLAPPEHRLGHSPLGALSVFALLLVLCLQVLTGLFSDDAIAFFGPLVHLASADVVQRATHFHTEVGRLLLIALLLLHIAAVLYYQWGRREPLVGAMWHGYKSTDSTQVQYPASKDGWKQRGLAVLLALACAALVGWVVSLAPTY